MSFYLVSLTKLEGVLSISYCAIETIDVQMLKNRSNHNKYHNVPEPDQDSADVGWQFRPSRCSQQQPNSGSGHMILASEFLERT